VCAQENYHVLHAAVSVKKKRGRKKERGKRRGRDQRELSFLGSTEKKKKKKGGRREEGERNE